MHLLRRMRTTSVARLYPLTIAMLRPHGLLKRRPRCGLPRRLLVHVGLRLRGLLLLIQPRADLCGGPGRVVLREIVAGPRMLAVRRAPCRRELRRTHPLRSARDERTSSGQRAAAMAAQKR